jgi:hypothetical protein
MKLGTDLVETKNKVVANFVQMCLLGFKIDFELFKVVCRDFQKRREKGERGGAYNLTAGSLSDSRRVRIRGACGVLPSRWRSINSELHNTIQKDENRG